MVKQPPVPQNTPKSMEVRKTERSNSKLSDHSSEKAPKHLKGRRRSDRSFKKRGTPESITFSKISEETEETPREIHCSCERLQNELFRFIDEFIESEEYQEYVKFKASIVKKDEEVQYDVNDLNQENEVAADAAEPMKKVDVYRILCKKALRVFFLEMQIERYASNVANKEIVEKQEEAIREKIAEVKDVFFCHKKERDNREKERERALIDKFIRSYNIDVSKLLSTKRLSQVILEVERKLRMKRRGHKNNIKSIVEKLVKEYQQSRACHKKRMKMIWSKRTDDGKKSRLLHIKGKKGSEDLVSSVHIPHVEDRVLKSFKDAGVCVDEDKIDYRKKKLYWDKSCGTDVPYATSDAYNQAVGIPNEIPFEDSLYKIRLDDYAKRKLGTVKSFVQFEDLLEARHFLCTCEKERKEKQNAELAFPDDTALVAPQEISIKGFKYGQIYTKKFTVVNRNGSAIKMKFFKIYFDDPKYAIYFEVEPEELRVLRPGLPEKVSVKFRPSEDMDVVFGLLVFLVCKNSTYYKHSILLECLPLVSDVTIEPQKLSFGTVPIWKFLKNIPDLTKTLKVKCSGDSFHKLVITKVRDPLELDHPGRRSPSYDDEYEDDDEDEEVEVKKPKTPAQLDVGQILDDILKEVNNNFRMDKRFLIINKSSGDQAIQVTPVEIGHPGFYMEKYRAEIYRVHEGHDQYKGMQEITLTLEVSDYCIKLDPTCVDFGVCFFGTAYQLAFDLINTSNVTQQVSILTPSLLSYYVSTDEKNAFVRSGERRKITVKLLPSYDLLTDKNKYFELDTYILYFPIKIKQLNRHYADAPPVIQHGYAIINDCSDLTLDPTGTEHYRRINGDMVLDMGECSVNEAVTCHVILRNSSYSTRYFCFTNIPEYVTIMPNYGIGSIHAFQEIDLKFYVHPRLEDFKTEGMDPSIMNEEQNFKIFVETVGNLGRYKRKPDIYRLAKLAKRMLNELRSEVDISMVGHIFETNSAIRTDMNLCTCASSKLAQTGESEDNLGKDDLAAIKSDQSGLDMLGSTSEPLLDSKTGLPKKRRKHHKPKTSSEVLRHKSSKEEMETHGSTESTRKKRRLKSLSDSEISRKTDEKEEEVEHPTLTKQPSLLEKKAVPIAKEAGLQIPANSLVNLADTLSRELRLKAVFIRPLYEFSYNHIEFPPTPGASYSTMTTELRPLKNTGRRCYCKSESRRKQEDCKATFRISGSTQEIKIEPMYGVLRHGESIKLTLVATPKINDDVVAVYAFDRKKSIIFKDKLAAEQEKQKEAAHKIKKKPKKAKEGKTKKKVLEESEEPKEESIHVEVLSDEVELGYLDFYPAEIALWRSIEPYFLNTSFVCHVEYEMDNCPCHPPDIFSLETVCKVVPPDFIHDQKSQRLDFGQTAIGSSKKRIITVQNLKYHDLKVTTSILRTEGNFCCPNFDSVQLPSENFLKIPITYKPTREEKVLEYMEIRAERTVYQFVLTAEGVLPNIRIQPSSRVIRVLAKRGKLLEIPFEIVNDSLLPITVSFQKVCELDGRITELPSATISKTETDAKVKKKKKEQKEGDEKSSKKSSSPHKKNRNSLSDELTESEIFSIMNDFSKKIDNPYFEFPEDSRKIALLESSKCTAKCVFGPQVKPDPATSQSSPQEKKKAKKEGRGKGDTISNEEDIGKTFVVKYNVLIDSSAFLRDFIILGEIK